MPADPLHFLRRQQKLRVVGRHPLRHLRQKQEFRTLLTRRLGHVAREAWAGEVGVCLDESGKIRYLCEDIVVEAL